MRLSRWLEKTGTKDATLAQTLGVAQSTVLRLKRGERLPSLSLAQKISQATNGAVTPQDFYQGVAA